MNILLICDDYYHPMHIVVSGISFLYNEGHTIDMVSDAEQLILSELENYSVVVFAKSDERSSSMRDRWETDEVQQAFLSYVENGGGLFAVHSGLVGNEGTDVLHGLIGCRFSHHPQQCSVTIAPVTIHEVTKGVNAFTEVDEQYFVDILADDIQVLLQSLSADGESPACYVRTQGRGRVCAFMPGHTSDVWNNAQTQQLVRNAVIWLSQLSC